MARANLGYNEYYTGEVTHKSTMDIPVKSIPSRAITQEEHEARGGLPLVADRATGEGPRKAGGPATAEDLAAPAEPAGGLDPGDL